MPSRQNTTRFRQNMKTPTNCRMRWMRVLASSRKALEAFANRPDVFKPSEIVHAGRPSSASMAKGALAGRARLRSAREDEARLRCGRRPSLIPK